MYKLLAVLLVFVAVAASAHGAGRPNILVILTDDQDERLGSVNYMDSVQNLLIKEGKRFPNAYVTTPVCCPSRSSILTGKYIHNTQTYNNSVDGGCASGGWRQRMEPFSIGARMHAAGYQTGYFGKYLNQYAEKGSGTGTEHIPDGWSYWYGLRGNSIYYNYTVSRNGTAETHGDRYPEDYLPQRLHDELLGFMDRSLNESSEPFFALFATPACHRPAQYPPQYEHLFENVTAPRTPSFTASGTGKHWLLSHGTPPMSADDIADVDELYRHRLRTLQTVDKTVSDAIAMLDAHGVLDNTYVFYVSDHGYHLGQFNQHGEKRQPYEENIRVPFFVRGPGISANSSSDEIALSIDLTPTIVHLGTGKTPLDTDGRSLVEALIGEDAAASGAPSTGRLRGNRPSSDRFGRHAFLIEYFGENNALSPTCFNGTGTPGIDGGYFLHDCHNNTFDCLRMLDAEFGINSIYCHFYDSDSPLMDSSHVNFVEYYDINEDEWELKNKASELPLARKLYFEALLTNLRGCSGESCHGF